MKNIEARLCPRVDSPCATPPNFVRGQVSAYCSGCQKTVYNLSAMTGEAQAQLLARGEPLCVRYRKILPAAAFALAITASATSAELASLLPPEDEILKEVTILGGGISLEPMFLESELDQSLDEPDAQELATGVKK